MLHIGVVEGAAAIPHGLHHLVGFGGDFRGGAVGHEACDREVYGGQFGAIFEDGDAAAQAAQVVGGEGHLIRVGADDNHVVAVMGHGGGHGHFPGVAEAGDEGVYDASRGAVAFDERDLGDVSGWLHAAFGDGEFEFERTGGRLVFDHADDVGGDGIGACGGWNREVVGSQIASHVDGLAGVFGPSVVRAIGEAGAVFSDDLATGDDGVDGERFEVGGKDHVGASARRERADFALQPEVCGGVDGGHL